MTQNVLLNEHPSEKLESHWVCFHRWEYPFPYPILMTLPLSQVEKPGSEKRQEKHDVLSSLQGYEL